MRHCWLLYDIWFWIYFRYKKCHFLIWTPDTCGPWNILNGIFIYIYIYTYIYHWYIQYIPLQSNLTQNKVPLPTLPNIFGILLNQTEIKLYIPCTDWFRAKRTSVWLQINRKRPFWARHWDHSKFTHFNTGILTRIKIYPRQINCWNMWIY